MALWAELWRPLWKPLWADPWGAPVAPATHEVFQVSDDGGVAFEVDDGASGHENFEVIE